MSKAIVNNNFKKLYRSKTNRWLGGVCGGLGEYFNIDPTVVRVLWIIGTLLSMGIGGLFAYIILWIVIPEK